jgi:signal transduction histidine kinase
VCLPRRVTVELGLNLPFRTDSLNLAALLYQLTLIKLPTVLPFVPLAVAAALIVWRSRPRTAGDLALQAAILNIVAFILAKQAFFNYYFASEVLLLAAMAGAGLALPEDDLALPDVAGLLRRIGIRMPPRRTPAAVDTAARPMPPPTRSR